MQVITPQMMEPEDSFSNRFNTGLQQLASLKLQQLAQRHAHAQQQAALSKGLQALGLPGEVSYLPQDMQKEVLKSYLSEGGLQDLLEPQPVSDGLHSLMQERRTEAPTLQTEKQPEMAAPTAPLLQETKPIKKAPASDLLAAAEKKAVKPIAITPEMEQKQVIPSPRLRRTTAIEQRQINKEVMPVYKDITEKASGAKEDLRRLDRMESLVRKGKLSGPLLHSLINFLEAKGYGPNLHFIESADSQEFDKLSKEFLKNAKNIFGSRITDADVNVIMKMVPSLTQSDEGKMRIINNMRAANQAMILRKNAANAIIKENGNRLPSNLDMLVDERVSPQLDKLSEEFKMGYGTNKEKSAFKKSWADTLIDPLG